MFGEGDLDLDYFLMRDGPMCAFSSPEALNGALARLKALNHSVLVVRCAGEQSYYRSMNAAFGPGPYSGWNGSLDALPDYLGEHQIWERVRVTLVLKDFPALAKSAGKAAGGLLHVLRDHAWMRALFGKRFVVLLDAPPERGRLPEHLGASGVAWNPVLWKTATE